MALSRRKNEINVYIEIIQDSSSKDYPKIIVITVNLNGEPLQRETDYKIGERSKLTSLLSRLQLSRCRGRFVACSSGAWVRSRQTLWSTASLAHTSRSLDVGGVDHTCVQEQTFTCMHARMHTEGKDQAIVHVFISVLIIRPLQHRKTIIMFVAEFFPTSKIIRPEAI